MMPIIIVSILATFIACNFLEWLVHGKFMHGEMPTEYLQKLAAHLFQNKHREHHLEYPPRNYQNSEHGQNVNLPWWAGALIVGGLTFPGMLISYFSGHWAISWCVAITSTFYFLAYNYVHTCYHVPAGRWLERTRFYNFMNYYHWKHHAREKEWGTLVNICLVCPLADWIMGTSLKSGR